MILNLIIVWYLAIEKSIKLNQRFVFSTAAELWKRSNPTLLSGTSRSVWQSAATVPTASTSYALRAAPPQFSSLLCKLRYYENMQHFALGCNESGSWVSGLRKVFLAKRLLRIAVNC